MNVQRFEVWNGDGYVGRCVWHNSGDLFTPRISDLRHFFLEPVSQTKKLIPGLVILSVQSSLPIIPLSFVNSAGDSSWLGLWQSYLVKVIEEMFSIYSF